MLTLWPVRKQADGTVFCFLSVSNHLPVRSVSSTAYHTTTEYGASNHTEQAFLLSLLPVPLPVSLENEIKCCVLPKYLAKVKILVVL